MNFLFEAHQGLPVSPMGNSGVVQTPTQGPVSYQQLYRLLPTLASSFPITVASSLF